MENFMVCAFYHNKKINYFTISLRNTKKETPPQIKSLLLSHSISPDSATDKDRCMPILHSNNAP